MFPDPPYDPLNFTYGALTRLFASRYGKGEYHAGAFFRSLYARSTSYTADLPAYSDNLPLAARVSEDFAMRLPRIIEVLSDDSSLKLLLRYADGVLIETVVLYMSRYATICVSTQAGCARKCSFCETGSLGLVRNLSAGEIVAQIMAVRQVSRIMPANLVFMGMGEPLDNYGAVLEAIEVISDQRGINIPVSSMTLSTAGHGDGIRRLAAHIRAGRTPKLDRLCLAVSLHSADDEQRSSIMPINRNWPLSSLQQLLRDYPLARERDVVFIEYTLIPGFNDSPEDAARLADYLKGIRSCVNLIPCNPGETHGFRRPTRDEVETFYRHLLTVGQYCRVRDTKGDTIQAACGQLGDLVRRRNRELRLP